MEGQACLAQPIAQDFPIDWKEELHRHRALKPVLLNRENGFGLIPDAIGRSSKFTSTQQRIIAILFDYISDKPYWKGIFPSHQNIAQRIGRQVSTVRRCLGQLRDQGWVDWQRTGRQNWYRLSDRFLSLCKNSAIRSPKVSDQIAEDDPLPNKILVFETDSNELPAGGRESLNLGEAEDKPGHGTKPIPKSKPNTTAGTPPNSAPPPSNQAITEGNSMDKEEPDLQTRLSKDYQCRKTGKTKGPKQTKSQSQVEQIIERFKGRCQDTGQFPDLHIGQPTRDAIKAMIGDLGFQDALEWVSYAVEHWEEIYRKSLGGKYQVSIEPNIFRMTAHWRYNEWKNLKTNQKQNSPSSTVENPQSQKSFTRKPKKKLQNDWLKSESASMLKTELSTTTKKE